MYIIGELQYLASEHDLRGISIAITTDSHLGTSHSFRSESDVRRLKIVERDIF